MKKSANRILCAALAAVSALSLTACGTETPESDFDDPLPWHSSADSYEKLEYDVAVYDTSKGSSAEKRIKIADGIMSMTIDENAVPGYTTLDTSFTVTYVADDIAGSDKGLTDTVTSRVEFEAKSLATKSMEKTVDLADRDGQTNLSYKLTADYFGSHKATYKRFKQQDAKEKTMSLPKNSCRDNEMMLLLARAQNIKSDTSTMFKMVNLFDSFLTGELAQYTMTTSVTSTKKTDIGDWVKDFGIEAETDEKTQATNYPVKCMNAAISISADRHGPAYYVCYSAVPFKQNETEHKKLPIQIEYSQYSDNKISRHTVYTLKSAAFSKQQTT